MMITTIIPIALYCRGFYLPRWETIGYIETLTQIEDLILRAEKISLIPRIECLHMIQRSKEVNYDLVRAALEKKSPQAKVFRRTHEKLKETLEEANQSVLTEELVERLIKCLSNSELCKLQNRETDFAIRLLKEDSSKQVSHRF